MRAPWCLLALLLLSLWSRPASAQFPVIDTANLFQNTITAVQSTISAVEAVIHTAKWIIEQTPLDELALGGEWAADMAQLEALVREAQALGYDVGSLMTMINTLFSLESAPDNTTDLQIRLFEIRRQVSLGYIYAMRTQTLIQTAIRTVNHLLRIFEQISALLGNLSGQQNLAQQLTKLVQLETEAKVSTTAFQRAQSLERITEPLLLESLERINTNIMRTHPR
jgi:conjugal transfer/entry exclusion protein